MKIFGSYVDLSLAVLLNWTVWTSVPTYTVHLTDDYVSKELQPVAPAEHKYD